MKALVSFGAIAATGWLFWHLNQESGLQADYATRIASIHQEAVDSAKSLEAQQEEAISKADLPSGIKEVARHNGWTVETAQKVYADAVAATDREDFFGSVVEHLSDGHLLVEQENNRMNGTSLPFGEYALFGFPDETADGDKFECQVVTIGTYQFATTAGGMATVREIAYIAHGQAPALR